MNKIITAAAVATFGAALALAPIPASATTYATVCNSADSANVSIELWNVAVSPEESQFISRGHCGVVTDNGYARVTVNYDYKIKPNGGSYGQCHGPNFDSNPPAGVSYYKVKSVSC